MLRPELIADPCHEHLSFVTDPVIAPKVIYDTSINFGMYPEVVGISAWDGTMIFDGEVADMPRDARLVLALTITGMDTVEVSRHVWLSDEELKNSLRTLIEKAYGQTVQADDMSDDATVGYRSGLARQLVRRNEPMARIVQPIRSNHFTSLTERQVQILNFVADGYSNKEVAARMQLAPGTIAESLSRSRQRIGAGRRVLIATGVELYTGPVSEPPEELSDSYVE